MTSRGRRFRWVAAAALGGATLAATLVVVSMADGTPRSAERLVVAVRARHPHDVGAFTQGLLWRDGKLFESTGLHGRSRVRRVDVASGRVEAEARLPDDLFGEGLAWVGGELWQLTWTEGRALVWDAATLTLEREVRYTGEGWGLCHDGQRFVMSDGSDRLVFRDTETFAVRGHVQVRRDGRPVHHLNELECLGGEVFANVWQTERIVRIDASTGVVTGVVDASGLLTDAERAQTDVLNGIAYLAERRRFLVTGKLWPHLFEVEFLPARAGP